MHSGWVIASATIAIEVSHLNNRRRQNRTSPISQERGRMVSYQFAVLTVSEGTLPIYSSYDLSCRDAYVGIIFPRFCRRRLPAHKR